MLKVALVNMPFADANRPSASLTQLKYLLDCKEGVETKIHYLNQDALQYFGADLVKIISSQYTSGLGDWVFRLIAFPEQTDNFQSYLGRHFPKKDKSTQVLVRNLLRKRHGLGAFLDQLIDRYQLDQVDVVGFSSMFSQNVASFALAKKLKDRNPNMITLMGGANCETPMGEVLVKNVPQIDFTFSGPALISMPQFIDCVKEGNLEAAHQIKGVFSKQNLDHLTLPYKAGEELPLDVPIPLDYQSFLTSFNEKFPELKRTKMLIFETSRGCWWGERSHCTFCGLNGASMGYRSMNSELAVQQFEEIFNYADDVSHFSCIDNIMPKDFIEKVFPKINPPDHVVIFYEVKADLSESDMKVLAEKRVKMVQPGIEALASSTLKLMKKGTTAFGNIIFLKNAALYDIRPEWNLLVGFPGEEEAVFEKYVADIPSLHHLYPPGGSFPVRFDRFSPYFMKAEQYELKLKPYEFYQYVYPFDEEARADMAYYFQDQNYEATYSRRVTKWIDPLREKVAAWNVRASGSDGLPRAELYFQEGSTGLIYDSRSGEVKEHYVGEMGRRVLEVLSRAKSLASLAAAMKDVPDFDPAKEIQRLQAMSLIFHEGTRYLSLVLPRKGPEPEIFRHEGRAVENLQPV